MAMQVWIQHDLVGGGGGGGCLANPAAESCRLLNDAICTAGHPTSMSSVFNYWGNHILLSYMRVEDHLGIMSDNSCSY